MQDIKLTFAHCRFKYVSRQDGKYKASVPDGKGARVRVGGYQTEEEAGKAVDVIRVFLVYIACVCTFETHH